MKLSLLVGVAVGYVVGTRAGRERYEQLSRYGRKIRGSQTVQSTAGVLQAQVDDIRGKALSIVADKLHSGGFAAGTTPVAARDNASRNNVAR